MQQAAISLKEPFHVSIPLPGSKNISRLALVIAALANGVSEISNLIIDDDIAALINTLRQLGIAIQLNELTRSCIIAGGNGKFPKNQTTLWCTDNPENAMLLLAACAAAGGIYYSDSSARLRQYAFQPLITILHRQGIQFIPDDISSLPFTLISMDGLTGDKILLDEPPSSHLLAALLVMSPFAKSALRLMFPVNSIQAEIDIICDLMGQFDVVVHHIHQGELAIPVPQQYQASTCMIEPDASLAVYFLAAAAISHGQIFIPLMKRESRQPNVKILGILDKMGCLIEENNKGLSLKGPDKLNGIDINVRSFSDLFVALCAIAPFAKTAVRISHIGKTSKPEMQLMSQVKNLLMKMGIHIESDENWIRIFPSQFTGTTFDASIDYRIGIMGYIMGLKTSNIIINNAESIALTHPDFFTLWNKLNEPCELI